MSQWTHVAGCIRIDNFIDSEERMESELGRIREKIGEECSYDDLLNGVDPVDSCNIPCGSEGSLEYGISKPYSPGLPWICVYIWGDLRDYNDQNEIHEWIKKICEGELIRNCCIKVDVERSNSYIIYDNHIIDCGTEINIKQL